MGHSIRDLKRIPNGAVASEVLRATAVLGTLRTGVMHALAFRATIATAVVQMNLRSSGLMRILESARVASRGNFIALGSQV